MRAVLWGAAAVVAMVLLVAFVAFELSRVEGPSNRMTSDVQEVRSPRLRSNPVDEIRAFEHEKRARLNSYGWVDREQGVAHVPIERAMQMLSSPHSSNPEAR